MHRKLQLVAVLLLTGATAFGQFHFGHRKSESYHRSDVEWLWEYGPSDTAKDGQENELVRDLRFQPMLTQYFTAPQTFWGNPGHYKSLPETVLDFLSVPDKVVAEDNRYVSISGCVFHFCPSRGLLWVDLNSKNTLMVFAAIDWIRDSKTTSQPGAEYTLWLFPDHPLSPDATAENRIPPALIHSIARWSAEPLAGSGIVQNITHVILVDPDGTPHQLPISAVGVTPSKSITTNTAATAAKPGIVPADKPSEVKDPNQP